ncbi:LIM domain binding protein, transcription coregulator [Schizosaccharomyces osmophilus]|uniref:LIM domain binding protein, transcription coregulator n=1 Tax=Schizosaccharomyces osmophilus TaxID=2545709 RepID=A0AAE9WBS7_9SCHI|nr:LIM domain binding protein, transcription coregulator [Schizosaccharomyces osmophilus]WBW72561.1 LIM domain binding protein, transcription coregulator [Schizosaccharomyces osmophilus]
MGTNYASMMFNSGSNILGYGVLRLLQYNEQLSCGWENTMKEDIGYWRRFVHNFFTEKGTFRFNFEPNAQRTRESKEFELSYAALPRFFYLNYMGNMRRMSIVLGDTKEFAIPNNGYFVESSNASLVYQFANGIQVIIYGCLRAHFHRAPLLKLDSLEFSATNHSEYLLRELVENASLAQQYQQERRPEQENTSIFPSQGNEQAPFYPPYNFGASAQLPSTPVNEYGIEPRIMRFLEISETISGMRDLIAFTLAQRSGPASALQKFATALQQQQQMQKSSAAKVAFPSNPSVNNQVPNNAEAPFPMAPSAAATGGPPEYRVPNYPSNYNYHQSQRAMSTNFDSSQFANHYPHPNPQSPAPLMNPAYTQPSQKRSATMSPLGEREKQDVDPSFYPNGSLGPQKRAKA